MFILEINTGNRLPNPADISRARELQGKIARTDVYIGDVLDLIATEESIKGGETKGYVRSSVNEARLANARAEKSRYQGELKSLDLPVNITDTSIAETGASENTTSSNPITSFIEDFIKPGIEAVKEFAKPVIEFFTDMFSSAKNIGSSIGSAISSIATAVSDGAKKLVGSVVSSTKEFYDKGVETVKNFFGMGKEDTKVSDKKAEEPKKDTKVSDKKAEKPKEPEEEQWSLAKIFNEMFTMLRDNESDPFS